MADDREEVDLSVGDKRLKISGNSVNLIFTILGCLLSALIAYVLWAHQGEAKEAQGQFVGAIKEQTTVMKESTAVNREQTCLLKFDQKDRQQNSDFCRQISGVERPR